jgi:hypothetical protein
LDNRIANLIEQRADLARIIDVMISQRLCHNHAGSTAAARSENYLMRRARALRRGVWSILREKWFLWQ